MTAVLGDFSSVPVAASVPQMVWAGVSGASVLLANQDLVNSVTIARRPSFAIGAGNTADVPALGSVTVDGSKSIWALAPANTANLLVMPGGSQWAPSPAQVAAQISALGLATLDEQIAQETNIPDNISTTGVPLLTNQVVAASSSGGTSIAASGTLTIPSSGTIALNQIGFELFVTAKYTTTAGTNPFLMCIVYFIDSVTGLTVDQTAYVLTAAGPSGTWPQRIKGPTKADSCRVVFYNLDTAQAITISYTLMINSRPYTQDAIDWLVSSFVGLPGTIPGHTLPAQTLPDTNTLAVFLNTSLAANASDGWMVPPQIGVLYLNIWESGVASGNMQVSVQELPSSVYGSNTPWLINDVMVGGNPDKYTAQFYAGRSPMQINVKNAGTVAANYIGVITSGVAD